MWALTLWLAAAPATLPSHLPEWPGCDQPVAAQHPVVLHRGGAFLSAHQLALVLRTLCPRAEAAPTWALISALSLAELDDSPGAIGLLHQALAGPDRDPRLAVALAWLHWRQGDRQAFGASLHRLPPSARARLQTLARTGASDFAAQAALLPLDLSPPVLAAGRRLDQARRTRRPWLAGSLSAVLPGAGQIYAGSWQSAAVAFALNAVLIGATVELARHRLYATAVAAGTVGSIFYVGNIVNAADLARRRNEAAALPAWQDLQQLLVPEVIP